MNDASGGQWKNELQMIDGLVSKKYNDWGEPKTKEELIAEFISIAQWDPSPDGRYLEWMVSKAIPYWLVYALIQALPDERNDWSTWEDGPVIEEVLDGFMTYTAKNSPYRKRWAQDEFLSGKDHPPYNQHHPGVKATKNPLDINTWSSFSVLGGDMERWESRNQIETSYYDGELKDLEPGAVVVGEDGNMVMLELRSFDGVKALCNKAKWCITNSDQTFRSFGPTYVFLEKSQMSGRRKDESGKRVETSRWHPRALMSPNSDQGEFKGPANSELTVETIEKIKNLALQNKTVLYMYQQTKAGIGKLDGLIKLNANVQSMKQILDVSPADLRLKVDVVRQQHKPHLEDTWNSISKRLHETANANPARVADAMVNLFFNNWGNATLKRMRDMRYVQWGHEYETQIHNALKQYMATYSSISPAKVAPVNLVDVSEQQWTELAWILATDLNLLGKVTALAGLPDESAGGSTFIDKWWEHPVLDTIDNPFEQVAEDIPVPAFKHMINRGAMMTEGWRNNDLHRFILIVIFGGTDVAKAEMEAFAQEGQKWEKQMSDWLDYEIKQLENKVSKIDAYTDEAWTRINLSALQSHAYRYRNVWKLQIILGLELNWAAIVPHIAAHERLQRWVRTKGIDESLRGPDPTIR
jgi:hypothetical protein